RRVGEAAETEVPVRRGGVPARPAVLGLVDLLQSEVEVVAVVRVDGEELVVPGLDAGAIALADPADLLRGAAGLQLLRGGDLGPGSGGIAVVGRIHALEQRLAVGADVEELWALRDGVCLGAV